MAAEKFNKTICFVRHPRTVAADGICYGNSDILPDEKSLPLTARKVLSKLEGFSPAICYTSPLSRCRLLAEMLMAPEKVKSDNLLREIDFATWEMKPWNQIPPDQQAIWGKDFINSNIHGGENFLDLQARVIRFWQNITSTDHNKILVVTHAGLLRALLSYLLKASPYKIFALEIDYGDIIRINWDSAEYYKIKYL